MLNLKKGDEVIIPAHTYCASAIPFARNHAKIIWADINFETRVVDIEDVKKKLQKTKAIVLVHLYGFAINVEEFKKSINNRKIKIVEDCAQSFGAEVNGRKAGTIGDFACFSFHSQKNITTLGEGGAIYVKNNFLSKKVKGLRHNGHEPFKVGRKNMDTSNDKCRKFERLWPYKFTLSEIRQHLDILC